MSSSFARKEVMMMTGSKPSNLNYFDSSGLVIPQRFGNPKRPSVVYSVEQVIQIKVIQRLREKLSLQEVRKILGFLAERNYAPSLFECQLVLLDGQLYLIEDMKEFGLKVLKASGKNKGQVVIHEIGKIGDVLSDLRKQAHESKVLDFEKRAKGTPLEVGV
jgi:DNA-binding transcriptional MerR regulator